jgi:hypothetical protein
MTAALPAIDALDVSGFAKGLHCSRATDAC